MKTDEDAVAALLKRGLRASLQSASLITGQQVVSLDFVPDAPEVPVTMEGSSFIMPTTESGGFASLAASATGLLNQVSTIPFEQIGGNLNSILKSANQAVQSPEMRKALTDVAATITSAQGLVKNLDSGLSPAARQLPELAATMQKTVANANQLIISLNRGYGDDTKFSRDLNRLLVQLNDMAQSFRSLADLLSRHPEALIKGRGGRE